MRRLDIQLVFVFLAATLAPLLITLWISVSLLDRSLSLSPNNQLDETSRALRETGRQLYLQVCQSLKRDAASGVVSGASHEGASAAEWPTAWREFWDSPDRERFVLLEGDRVDYLVRRGSRLLVYSTPLPGVHLDRISTLYARARSHLASSARRDLRRGFSYTLIFLAAAIWILSFAFLVYWARRLSRPIRQLNLALAQVAAGNLKHRVDGSAGDEIGAAMRAFNEMAAELERSRDRLVWITRLESWQALARKTAHEVKNSLTPIRLAMEELAVRGGDPDRKFLEQAAQIVVDEVGSLERRVRAFSELASEPPVRPRHLPVNALVEERVAFLRSAHAETVYSLRLAESDPFAWADEDLVKGILTNLLENAAEAAPRGSVLAWTKACEGEVWIEIHDSGPGLSAQARETLFEPSISFKAGGMGLGLSIARKSAVLLGGDIVPIPGDLGGAAFRVVLPAAGLSPGHERDGLAEVHASLEIRS